MSAVTIAAASRDVVTWRVGNSLHIESNRDAVDAWIGEADFMGHVDVDGLILTPGDLANMAAAMDDAAADWSPPREDGVLSVHQVGRDSIRFAIGRGPFTYTSPAKVHDAIERREQAGTETVQLSGYWLDEGDLEVMSR